MSATLPCPGCGADVLGGYLLASGLGIILDPDPWDAGADFSGTHAVVYALHGHGLATPTRGIGHRAHHCGAVSFDAVVTVLRGQAAVRPCDARAERAAKKALGGRLAGPVGALAAVLNRLRADGLSVFTVAPP